MQAHKTPVLILQWGSKGAGPRLSRELFRALEAYEDLEVYLSCSSASGVAQHLKEAPVDVLEVRTYSSLGGVLRRPWLFLHNFYLLRRFILSRSIEVVVSPMLSVWQSPGLWAAIPRHVKYVSTIHDSVLHDGDESYAVRFSHKAELRRANAVVALSKSVAKDLRRHLRPNQSLVLTVHPSFPRSPGAKSATRAASQPQLGTVRIGMFGRLFPYQGVDIFAESVSHLREEGLNVQGVVFGSANPEVEKLAMMHDHIDWHLGWVPENEVNETVASFDILALPYREASQSGVLAVALAEGVPIVATPVGGLAEQVVDTGIGVLSEEVSVKAFAKALRLLIEDPELRLSLGVAARESAGGTYSWRRVAEDYRHAILD